MNKNSFKLKTNLRSNSGLKELLDFLEENNCVYVTHRSLKKEEVLQETKGMNIINRLYSFHSDYEVIGYSIDANLYRKYKMRITNNIFFFMQRSLQFTLEKDEEVNKQLQKDYTSKISIIIDKCPACKTTITKKETNCSSCGLMINDKSI